MYKYLLVSLLTMSTLYAMDRNNQNNANNNKAKMIRYIHEIPCTLPSSSSSSGDDSDSEEDRIRFWIGESLADLQRKFYNK